MQSSSRETACQAASFSLTTNQGIEDRLIQVILAKINPDDKAEMLAASCCQSRRCS
jgi:hypothetical protein